MGSPKTPNNEVKYKYCNSNYAFLNKKDIQDIIRKEDWLNHHTRDALKDLTSDLKPPDSRPPLILEDLEDITKTNTGIELAKKYEPRITLLGQELRAERGGKTWGGMYFRVLEGEKGGPLQDKICIQYIYTWVQQKLPISVWNWLLPLIGLLIFSFFFNGGHELYPLLPLSICVAMLIIPGINFIITVKSEGFFPQRSLILCGLGLIVGLPLFIEWTNPSTSIITWFFITLPLTGVLDLRIFILVLLLLCITGFLITLIELIVAYKSQSRKEKEQSEKRRTLPLSSLVILVLEVIILIILVVLLIFSFNLSTPIVYWNLTERSVTFDVNISITTLFLVSYIILFSGIIKGQYSKNRIFSWVNRRFAYILENIGIHSMDYAPIFIYLKKEPDWKFVGSQWDRMHYCCDHLTETKDLAKYKSSEDSRQQFLLKNSWHSFSPITSCQKRGLKVLWWISIIIALLVTSLVIFWWVQAIFFQEDFLLEFTGRSVAGIEVYYLLQILSGLFMVGAGIAIISLRQTELTTNLQDLKEDLGDKSQNFRTSYLNCQKLQVFWNLPDHAEFLIQKKLQTPMLYKKYEHDSFYDDDHDKAKSTICEISQHPIWNYFLTGITYLIAGSLITLFLLILN